MPKPTTANPTLPGDRPLTKTRYAELLRDVQALVTTANKAVDQQKVKAHWRLGQRITRERLTEQRGYHNSVLRDLALDTRIGVRTLQYAVTFHHTYKVCPKSTLSWAHYRHLLDRPTSASRAHYEALATAQGLSAGQLARLIAHDRLTSNDDAELLARPTEPSYLYGAKVEQVVDGDTLDLRIDLGFHVDRRGRFRLANINCPELPTTTGRAARDFVFQRLLTAKTIVVKTQRTDLHGRYVTHLFYTPANVPIDDCFKSGTYLNAELLEANHAELVV